MLEREVELKAALRQLPAPDVGADLLSRILHSRAMGTRISLPVRTSVPWRWIGAAAAVAVLISGSWVVSLSLSKLGESRGVTRDQFSELLSRRTWQADGVDEAAPRGAGIPQPRYPLILSDAVDPSRLTEGTWSYQATTTTDDVLTQTSGRHRVRVSRATYAHRPAWMVNIAKESKDGWSDYPDTVYLDAESLRPMFAVAYGYKLRSRMVQSFSSQSSVQSLEITGPMKRLLTGVTALPFPPNAIFTNDWSPHRFSALLPAFPFARGWRGSLYQTGFFSRGTEPGTLVQQAIPVDLRLVGRDRVTVPAGTFDCWRVELENHPGETERRILWVSRDAGWLIKMQTRGWSDVVVTEVLEAYDLGTS